MAGADSVVLSNAIGGLRMVSELIRPAVVGFLDKMLRAQKGKSYRFEDLKYLQTQSSSARPLLKQIYYIIPRCF